MMWCYMCVCACELGDDVMMCVCASELGDDVMTCVYVHVS